MATAEVISLTPGNDFVDAGESSRYTVVFKDFDAETIAKAAILSIELNITTEDGTQVVSGRDVLDNNGGAVASSGTLTLFTGPSDSVFYSGDSKYTEKHTYELAWSWDDGTATRYGRHKWTVTVRQMPQ